MRINIDTQFLHDSRVELMAQVLGVSKYAARGHLLPLWHYCYEHTVEVLTTKEVNIWGEHPRMAEAMEAADLAEFTDDGRVRIKGAKERYQWVIDKREQAARAGKLSAAARRLRTGSAVPPNATNRKNPNGRSEVAEQNPTETEPSLLLAPCSLNTPLPPKPEQGALAFVEDVTPSASAGGEEEKSKRARKSKTDVPSPRELADLWNELKAPVQLALNQETFKPGSKRWTHAQSRLKENPDLAYWRRIIGILAASKLCTGKSESGWIASFEFLVKPETHIKATEGWYPPAQKAPLSSMGHIKIVQFDENGEVVA